MSIGRRAVLRTLLGTGVGLVAGTGSYGYLYERHAVEGTRVEVPIAGAPPALVGFRIGFLTDLHRSRWVSHDDVARAVALLMNERPDLAVLGGDYVTWGDRRYVQSSAEALAPLSAPHGVFGILGNHDDDHDMPAALTRINVQMLKDARTRVIVNGEPIAFVGIRYWTRRLGDIAPLVRGATGTIVLLAHDPRRLNE